MASEIRITQARERSAAYHRDQFVGAFVATEVRAGAAWAAEGAQEPVRLLVERAARLLQLGARFQRLQEQQCNGEGYYHPHTPYIECPVCGDEVPKRAMVGTRSTPRCIDCKTRAQITALLPEGWRVRFQGDPRGAVVMVCYAPNEHMLYDDCREVWYYPTLVPKEGRADVPHASAPRWLVVA